VSWEGEGPNCTFFGQFCSILLQGLYFSQSYKYLSLLLICCLFTELVWSPLHHINAWQGFQSFSKRVLFPMLPQMKGWRGACSHLPPSGIPGVYIPISKPHLACSCSLKYTCFSNKLLFVCSRSNVSCKEVYYFYKKRVHKTIEIRAYSGCKKCVFIFWWIKFA